MEVIKYFMTVALLVVYQLPAMFAYQYGGPGLSLAAALMMSFYVSFRVWSK